MKKILFAAGFFLTAFTVYSQTEATTKSGVKVLLHQNGTWTYNDCSQLLETKTYTGGKVMTSAKENIKISTDNGVTGIDIALIKGTEAVILNFTNLSKAVLCVNKNAPMIVEFGDGTKTTLVNPTDLNCNGRFACFLGENLGNVKDLELLKLKKIKKVTIEYTDTENGAIKKNLSVFTFNDAQADKFMKTIQCLSNL